MVALICDGSYHGLLSALFEAHAMKPAPEEVLLCPPAQQLLIAQYINVPTDEAKAARIERAIREKLSPTSISHVEMLAASAMPEAGTLLFRYLKLGWKVGKALDDHLVMPEVMDVIKLSRRVAHEINKFTGFVRFSSLESGVLYAELEPDHDIVPHLASHFVSRMPAENWVLHDTAHGTAALHRPGDCRIVRGAFAAQDVRQGDEFKDLWRAFYDAIAIKQRISDKRRRALMPKRYWKHLPEVNPKL